MSFLRRLEAMTVGWGVVVHCCKIPQAVVVPWFDVVNCVSSRFSA
jgi:hypothetical protein